MSGFYTIFLIFISFSFIYPQNINRLFEEYISSYYLNKKVPSITAGVLMGNKIVWISTKGFSDLENNVRATDKTLYRIASISKSMTAVGIMQLVESGKLNLDDPVKKYIPYLPVKQKSFSIRQLLNHTSGIRTYRENEFDNKTYFSSTRDVVLYIMKDPLVYNPGEVYLYSTLGYNLLAAVIENVSGMNYGEYMRKNIFDPSGMTLTIPDYQKNLIHNRARGYIKDLYRQTENAPLADLSIKYAGGGLLSNAEDILRFSLNLMNGKLIKPETLDSMLTPARLNSGKYINYGLGLSFETDETGRKSFSHSGGGTGFTSHFVIYPNEKIAAVYLTNIRDRNLENPAKILSLIAINKNKISAKKSLADYMMEEYIITSLDSVLSIYNIIKTDSLDVFNTGTEELYFFGHDLLSINRTFDAIKYYKFLITLFPDDARAFIGLANAYFADGNKGLALRNYRIALRLDPTNTYVSNMINKINGLK